jgi:hypothetical protein
MLWCMLLRVSPETWSMAGGGTRNLAGSRRSPSYCIMPTNSVYVYQQATTSPYAPLLQHTCDAQLLMPEERCAAADVL